MSAAAPPPAAPDWDMTPWFDALGSPSYRRFRRELDEELAALEAALDALGAPDDAGRGAFVAWLGRLEAWSARNAHWNAYLGCLGAADARDPDVQRDTAEAHRARARVGKLFTALREKLLAADPADFAALRAEPAIAHAGYFLGRLREEAARRMPRELEGLASDLEVTGLSAWGRLYDRVSGTLEFDLEVPGEEPRRLPASMVRSLLGDARPEVRRAALAGAHNAWGAVGEVCAASLNAIAGTRLELYRRRGIGHFLEPALFDAAVSRATLDAMLEAVRARRELARRYLRAKARVLGVARLGFQDLEAPLPGESASRLGFDEARRRVLAAFEAFHPPLGALAARAFEARWIDHAPRPGKRPGGFCSTSPLVQESRIFMTFAGSAGDVSTLAHELGHAYHGAVVRDVPPFARRYPMTLAETASTFAEQVLHDATLADPASGPTERAGVLDRRLRDAAAFLLNLPMRFDFEVGVYEARARGELSVAELCERMLEAQRAWYGDALDEGALDPWFWASKLHFYLTGISFYNFPYTFGYLLSLGLFARARAEGASFLPHLEALLRRAGTAPAHEVVRACVGEDLEGPHFWDASLDAVEGDLVQYEREVAPGPGPPASA